MLSDTSNVTGVSSHGSPHELVVGREVGQAVTWATTQEFVSSKSVRHRDDVDNGDNFMAERSYDCTQVQESVSDECPILQSVHKIDPLSVDSPVATLCPISLRLSDPVELGGVKSQMKPAIWDYYLQYEDNVEMRNYLWSGISDGFDIVDRNVVIESYECENYNSCLTGSAYQYVDNLINNEICDGKFVMAEDKPHCIHALGAIPKNKVMDWGMVMTGKLVLFFMTQYMKSQLVWKVLTSIMCIG